MAITCSYFCYDHLGRMDKIKQIRIVVQIRSMIDSIFDKLYQTVGGFEEIDKKSIKKFFKYHISNFSSLPKEHKRTLKQIIGASFKEDTGDKITIEDLTEKAEKISEYIIENGGILF